MSKYSDEQLKVMANIWLNSKNDDPNDTRYEDLMQLMMAITGLHPANIRDRIIELSNYKGE